MLILVDELSGERLDWATKTFTNQQAGLETLARQLGLADDARILLQFDDEERWFSLSALRRWSERFAVDIGWSLCGYADDDRAQARLMLMRSDGVWSWGDARPMRPRPISDD
jgi:hypothetical protein